MFSETLTFHVFLGISIFVTRLEREAHFHFRVSLGSPRGRPRGLRAPSIFVTGLEREAYFDIWGYVGNSFCDSYVFVYVCLILGGCLGGRLGSPGGAQSEKCKENQWFFNVFVYFNMKNEKYILNIWLWRILWVVKRMSLIRNLSFSLFLFFLSLCLSLSLLLSLSLFLFLFLSLPLSLRSQQWSM